MSVFLLDGKDRAVEAFQFGTGFDDPFSGYALNFNVNISF